MTKDKWYESQAYWRGIHTHLWRNYNFEERLDPRRALGDAL